MTRIIRTDENTYREIIALFGKLKILPTSCKKLEGEGYCNILLGDACITFEVSHGRNV